MMRAVHGRERLEPLPFVALAVDVAIAIVASVLGWHPVDDWLAAHRRELHVALVVTFGAVTGLPILYLLEELREAVVSRLEEAIVPPAFALFCLLGWLVPYALGGFADPGAPPSLAVAPFLLFGVGLIGGTGLVGLIGTKPARLEAATRLFRMRAVRVALAAIVAAWFFACEATFFLALASNDEHRWLVWPLAVLAYLPIRWILQVLTGASRSERWTLWLAFAYLLVRLAFA